MKRMTLLSALVTALFMVLVTVSSAAAQDLYTCRVSFDDGGFSVRCDRPAPEPTVAPTPEPTATPIPEPTATVAPPMDMADMMWHAPGTHGDRPFHEHGDAAPAWVTDAGEMPMFVHDHGTPNENVLVYKHTGFKQWAGNFNGQEWFGVFHLDVNPAGQNGRFHSYQLWVKDATGAVSSFSGWLDFGVGNKTGPQKVVVCATDSTVRPIIMVNRAGCQPRFENWYARAGGSGAWAPDFGFNINPNYFDGDPAAPATWQPINGFPNNVERRIEFAWYPGRSAQRGEFWADQFGRIVSGPQDALCGSQQAVGDRTYTVACSRQYIAPTLQGIQYPGNAVQRSFPEDGVVLPN